MKSLNALNTSAFANCTINNFNAPNLNAITTFKKIKFYVGTKNFPDSPSII